MDRGGTEDFHEGAQDLSGPVRMRSPRIDVRTVLRGAREVILVHGTEEYRLKGTAAGKLILTK